jgi:predicted amidohydrolase YtcJ
MGSDWSVSSPNPLWEMHIAVERRAPKFYAGERDVFLPDERLDLIDALAGFTCNAAYVNHLDDETGTIEHGKLADLAILDRDLFDRAEGAIGDTRVVGTFVEGVSVYETADLGG